MNNSIFSTVERRILFAYLGLSLPSEQAEAETAARELGIDPDRCGGPLTPLSVAAARILTPGRRAGETGHPAGRNVVMMPRQTLRVFWGDQVVGMDTYSLVWLPGFRRFVVTAAGSERNYGYRLFAIGHFEPTSQLREALGSVLRGWWRTQRDAGRDRWLCCESSALVPESHAIGWRELAWQNAVVVPIRRAV